MGSTTRLGYRSRALAVVLVLALLSQLIWPGIVPGSMRTVASANGSTPQFITFYYDRFDSQADARLLRNGATAFTDGRIRLTPAQGDRFGTVFNQERVILQDNSSFSTYFQFQLTNQGNRSGFAPGADGLVFTVQTQANDAGSVGEGIGYAGIQNSIGIEFDTYHNDGSPILDPNDNHIGIHANGVVSHSGKTVGVDYTEVNGINFKSGNVVHAWIDYSGANSTIQVYLSNNEIRPQAPILTKNNFNITSLLGRSEVYVGFTSATGSAWQNHDILAWYFNNRFMPIDTNSNTYAEAPSLFTSQVAYENDLTAVTVTLRNSAQQAFPGLNIALSNIQNGAFYDAQGNALSEPPALVTDANGKATLYVKSTNGQQVQLRVSNEYGAYRDLTVPVPPTIALDLNYEDEGFLYNFDNKTVAASVRLASGGNVIVERGIEFGYGDSFRTETTTPGTSDFLLTMTNIEPDIEYTARAYVITDGGTTFYSDPATFFLETPLPPADSVSYESLGPTHIYTGESAKWVRVSGTGFNGLTQLINLRNYPARGAVSYELVEGENGEGQVEAIPLSSISILGANELQVALPDDLAVGTYTLRLRQGYFTAEKDFTFTITDDKKYESRKFGEIVMNNPNPAADEIAKVVVRGPFAETAPGVYTLSDPGQIVTLNDYVKFKGQSLTVDLSDPQFPKLRAKGRMYVTALDISYTLHEGDFELDSDDFVLTIMGQPGLYDYLGLNMPIILESIAFVDSGLRMKGRISLKWASLTPGGKAPLFEARADISALQYANASWDLDALFSLSKRLSVSSFDSNSVRVGINTFKDVYSFGATAYLPAYNNEVGFELDLGVMKGQLDFVLFSVLMSLKIPKTGMQFTKLGGGLSNMASANAYPLTINALGGMSDYVSPEVFGKNLVNFEDLKIGISVKHLEASGKLMLYFIDIATGELLLVVQPDGYPGYRNPGIKVQAEWNVLDAIIGEFLMKYFLNESFEGLSNSLVQVPPKVPVVGGAKLQEISLGVNEQRIRGSMSYLGTAFSGEYIFKDHEVDFEVDVKAAFTKIGVSAMNLGSAAVDAIKSTPEALGKLLKGDLSGVIEIGKNLGGAALEFGSALVGGVLSVGAYAVAGAAKVLASGIKAVAAPIKAVVSTVTNAVSGVLNAVLPKAVTQQVAAVASTAVKKTVSVVSNVVSSAASGVKKAASKVGSFFRGLFSARVDYQTKAAFGPVSVLSADNGAQEGNPDLKGVSVEFDGTDDSVTTALFEIANATEDTALYRMAEDRQSGQRFTLDFNPASPGYNAYRENGVLFIWVNETSETLTGEWFVIDRSKVVQPLDVRVLDVPSGYRMATIVSDLVVETQQLLVTIPANDADYPAMFKVTNADRSLTLWKPDGAQVELDFDPQSPAYNALYMPDEQAVYVVQAVDKAGEWKVLVPLRGSGTPEVELYELPASMSMQQVMEEVLVIETSTVVEIGQRALNMIVLDGTDETVRLVQPNGTPYPLQFNASAAGWNAIYVPEQDRVFILANVQQTGDWNIVTRDEIHYEFYTMPAGTGMNTVRLHAEDRAFEVEHAFALDRTYRGLLQLDGATSQVRLVRPNGTELPIVFTGSNANALYDASTGRVYVDVHLDQTGVWKLVAPNAVRIESFEWLGWNGQLTSLELIREFSDAEEQQWVPLRITEPYEALVQVSNASAVAAIYQPDGVDYPLVYDATHRNWNAYRAADGTLYVKLTFSQLGTWAVNGGEDTRVVVYRLDEGSTMQDVVAFADAPEFATAVQLDAVNGRAYQALLTLQLAGPDIELVRPDGTVYPLQSNPDEAGWNLYYDANTMTAYILAEVSQFGEWLVRSDGNVDVTQTVFSRPLTDLHDYFTHPTNVVMDVEIEQPAGYVLAISNGNRQTRVFDSNGLEVPLVFADANGNANANANEDASRINANLNEEDNLLYVHIQATRAGVWRVRNASMVSIAVYEAPPAPEVVRFDAADAPGYNRFKLDWEVANAKEDTVVSIMLTDNPEEPVGSFVAEGLPSAGSSTITLPEGFMPGQYWLVLKADSEQLGPIYRLASGPISVAAIGAPQTPPVPAVASTGNGEITLEFTDPYASEVSYYRIVTADANGRIHYTGMTWETPSTTDRVQRVVVSGLETGKTHYLAVLAVREGEPNGQASLPSAPVEVYLPVPAPPQLTVAYDDFDAGLHGAEIDWYDGTRVQRTLIGGKDVDLRVQADQNGQVHLYLNDEYRGTRSVTAGQEALFELRELEAREYAVELISANAQGDIGYLFQQLVVEPEAPYLFLNEPINGQLSDGERIRLNGMTDPSAVLTVNGQRVPTDSTGRFDHYYSLKNVSGNHELIFLATSLTGKETEHRLEVMRIEQLSGPQVANNDLASLTVLQGQMTPDFHPETQQYTVSLPAHLSKLGIGVQPASNAATVTIAQAAGTNAEVALSEGVTQVPIVVLAAGGGSKTYTLQVSRSGADFGDASLQALGLSAGELSPEFAAGKLVYQAQVPVDTTELVVTPQASDPAATIRVNGSVVASGAGSQAIPLAVGSTSVAIEVTAGADSSKKRTYLLTVYREASANAQLASVQINGETLVGGGSDGRVYRYQASADTETIALRLEAEHPEATLRWRGAVVQSGVSFDWALSAGTQQGVVEVIAADGTIEAYRVIVTRDIDADTLVYLTALTVTPTVASPGGGSFAFDPLRTLYRGQVATEWATLSLSALPSDVGASLFVNNEAVAAGEQYRVPLRYGNNFVEVRVTRADGKQSVTYMLWVYRQHPTFQFPSTGLDVSFNGEQNRRLAYGNEVQENGRTVQRITFDSRVLNEMLAASGRGAIIRVGSGAAVDRVEGMLTGQDIKDMAGKEALLLLRTPMAHYTLPTAAMDMDAVSQAFGAAVPLQDIVVHIRLSQPDANERSFIEQAVSGQGGQLLGEPVQFQVVYAYGGREIAAERFVRPIERALPISDEDAGRITTGVQVMEDGTLYPVPTYVRADADGAQWVATMHNFSNSRYALVAHDRSFADTSSHWARTAIEDLASRFVLSGRTEQSFVPNDEVTRAEYVTMIVRALGVLPEGGQTQFSDVSSSSWYAPQVAAAVQYGLISGYADGTFRPNRPISRQEAVVILQNARRLAGFDSAGAADALGATGAAGAVGAGSYADADQIAGWAQAAVRQAVEAGILRGYPDGTFRPTRSITRAEAAVIIRQMLIVQEWIQP